MTYAHQHQAENLLVYLLICENTLNHFHCKCAFSFMIGINLSELYRL